MREAPRKRTRHLVRIFCAVALATALGCPNPNDPGDNGDGGDDAPTWSDIEINFLGSGGIALVDQGSTLDPGTILEGAERDLSFEITNWGFGPLYLIGSPPVAISGADEPLCAVVVEPATTVEASDSTPFSIRISPSGIGDISVVVTVQSNALGKNLFTFVLSGSVTSPPAAVPATGQTTSYHTGDDGDLQRGVVWPATRFTDNADETTTDNLTGLMWASAAGGTSITWEGALTVANNSTLGGHDDWRSPNVNELMTLVSLEASDPNSWLNGLDEFSGVQHDDYWTSTWIYQPATTWGWVVHMDTGVLARVNISAIPSGYSWKVRDAGGGSVAVPRTGRTSMYRTGDDGDLQAGVAWPSPRFVENGEEMVLDLLTGLLWCQSPSSTTMTWDEALDHVSSLDTGGHADWRVPNRNEMRSLCSYDYYNWNTYFYAPFSGPIPAGEYWTSSTLAGGGTIAWVILLETGHAQYTAKTDSRRVWAVRAGM